MLVSFAAVLTSQKTAAKGLLMRTLDGEIGDLERRSCQLVVQNTGQV